MELGELHPELRSSALMGQDLESNKRAPSGFQGVRGKKWTGKFCFIIQLSTPQKHFRIPFLPVALNEYC